MTEAFIPLPHLLTAGRPPNAVVCVDGGNVIEWARFTAHVGRLTGDLASRGPGRWLIFTENTYAFAVALLAVWQSGGVAVLAPNGQTGTLSELSEGTRGLITERVRAAPGVDRVDVFHGPSASMGRWSVPDRTTWRLELFTSGSTGTRKVVRKTIANLDDEVAGLERHWGSLLQGREAFGTVSHQHIYGLLFRVLWPLAAGRTFRAQTYLHAEEMAAAMAPAASCFLVASPAHLSRLKGFPGTERMAAYCRPTFSSGGPLDGGTAAALRGIFGAAPFEIFGSTETGGVAWRQQTDTDSLAWRPFADVIVDLDPHDGLLRVRSPFVSGGDGVFTMADRARLCGDGRFVLGPRSDRTVKLGDRRLSLPDMEATLTGHPFVSQAVLVVLEQGTGTRLGAAVVLTPAGREALGRQGRRAVSQALLHTLEPYWDRILLPRAWRYMERLPEDAQGKVTTAALQAVFASPYDPAVVAPELVEESRGAGTCRQTLRVPDTLGCLEGHFAALPVVPGATQVQWVMDVTRVLLGGEVLLGSIEALKFKELLRPGEVFHLQVELSTTRDQMAFRLWNERAVFSSGRCRLGSRGRGGP